MFFGTNTKQKNPWKSVIEEELKKLENEESYKANFTSKRVSFNFPDTLKIGIMNQSVSDYRKISIASNVRNQTPIGNRKTEAQSDAEDKKKFELSIHKQQQEAEQLQLPPSSTIQAATYYPERQYLIVSFKSGGTYNYQKVDLWTITDWESASSAGSFFYYNIRWSFKFQKMG